MAKEVDTRVSNIIDELECFFPIPIKVASKCVHCQGTALPEVSLLAVKAIKEF